MMEFRLGVDLRHLKWMLKSINVFEGSGFEGILAGAEV
jgi:hypothetical protein